MESHTDDVRLRAGPLETPWQTTNKVALPEETPVEHTLASPFEEKYTMSPRTVDAPEGAYTNAVVPSDPAVATEEYERAAAAIEIVIRWGESVLHVAHLTPPRSFSVGEAQGKEAPSDFFLPAEMLGAARLPLLVVDGDADARLVIPAHATGTITSADGAAMSLRDALARGLAAPSAALGGAHELALGRGSRRR